MADKGYPTAGEFVSIPKTVQAMQYDGTIVNAYEILAWVHRNDGIGYCEFKDGYRNLNVGLNDLGVTETNWVVYNGPGDWEILTDYAFRSKYIPNVKREE